MRMKKRVNVSLDEQIHERGVALAKEVGTDFSGWITQQIVAASKKKRGSSPTPTSEPVASEPSNVSPPEPQPIQKETEDADALFDNNPI